MIQMTPDLFSLSSAAAELFIRQARKASEARGRFSVALSGGGTPRRTYELLALPPFRNRVDWSKVHVFWGDERCVPSEDPRSNARMAQEALLSKVPIPPDQIHPIVCAESPETAARDYEALLRAFFNGPPRFDLVFLGMGENGHTASLFPENKVLREEKRWAAELYIAEQDIFRVTLTPLVFNQAESIAFLVSGTNKASVLKRVIEGPRDPFRLPAQLIQPLSGELIWLVDRDAASWIGEAGNQGRGEWGSGES